MCPSLLISEADTDPKTVFMVVLTLKSFKSYSVSREWVPGKKNPGGTIGLICIRKQIWNESWARKELTERALKGFVSHGTKPGTIPAGGSLYILDM
jgi:hypothetical protein